MIKQIIDNVWQFYYNNSGSNCYLLKSKGKNILIDTSGEENRQELLSDLRKIKVNHKNIDIILLTHLHYDHVGNIELFENAKVYASEREINDFKKQPFETVLNENFLSKIKIQPIENLNLKSLEIIETPGHTRGSLCFYMPKEKILFSGDTLFDDGTGRTDLPTSDAEKMQASLKKLENLDYKILCPGH